MVEKRRSGITFKCVLGGRTIHIIIYRDASLKGLRILCKKLLYHLKKIPGSAQLAEHDRGVIYRGSKLKGKKTNSLASELFRLLKKRGRYLRLVLTQENMGGSLHEDWMHRPDALRKIGQSY